MLTCRFCKKQFKYDSEKKRHEKSHVPQFECSECFKKFSFISALRRHQKQHKRTERVNCPQCGRSFRDETLLQRHIKYAHKETHVCSKCQVKFNSPQALQSHQKTHKLKSERRYKCSNNGCMKTFNFAHHLKNHELTHSGLKQHYCNSCGKGFIQLHHLKTHLRSHQPYSWLKCSITGCDKLFTNEYALKRHIATHRNICVDVQSGEISSKYMQDSKPETIEGHMHIDIDKVIQKEPTDWFDKYQLIEDLSLIENTVTEQNNNVQNIHNTSYNVDNNKALFNIATERRNTDLIENKDLKSNCKACACDKEIKCSAKRNMPILKYNSDGTIKIKEFFDEDIKIIINSTKEDNIEEGRNKFSNNLITYNNCKDILGRCIVSGSGTISEDCLCAKMAIDDDSQMISQEIDEITPQPITAMT